MIDLNEYEVTRQTFAVGFEEPTDSSPTINVDKFSTGPLTESENFRLRHKLGVRMATRGFNSVKEIENEVQMFLQGIGKSNFGKKLRPGIGWVDAPY